jgi:hypothetical protein
MDLAPAIFLSFFTTKLVAALRALIVKVSEKTSKIDVKSVDHKA